MNSKMIYLINLVAVPMVAAMVGGLFYLVSLSLGHSHSGQNLSIFVYAWFAFGLLAGFCDLMSAQRKRHNW